ncbi:MAG: F0F1 ATP synthase subunit A, partial [Pseudomonadota bacterium]|nr:F0F1 ATP synthase subunit A [Pseudomonadota bacterium]
MASAENLNDQQSSSSFPADPMHQFEIKKYIDLNLGGLDISFTNSSLFMLIAVTAISFFMIFSMRKNSIIPSRLQSAVEISYEFVSNMVRQNVGSQGKTYFPFIFTIFMFVLFLNMLGMIPYAFTVTSHIAVTFGLAILIFIGVTIIGFIKHGMGFLGLFVPKGVPIFMLPLLVVIEL